MKKLTIPRDKRREIIDEIRRNEDSKYDHRLHGILLVEMALINEYNGLSPEEEIYEFFLNFALSASSPFAITGLGFLNLKPSFRNILWHCLVPRSMSYLVLR